MLNYAKGARVTYISPRPYSAGDNNLVSKNSGFIGKNSPVNSNLEHSKDNFWGLRNTWCTQGSLENDDNKNSISLTHKGETKNSKSSTTISVSDRSSTTTTIIINSRAYQGDVSKYMFKMSECYLASANSDGDVGKLKIHVSTSSEESFATTPNDSRWSYVTEGSLTTYAVLTKVYSGNVNFRYIKLNINSRGIGYCCNKGILIFFFFIID